MFVLARRSPPRCAYCHESLVNGFACAACGAALHPECRAELGRCPSLGCRCTAFELMGDVRAIFAPCEAAIRSFLSRVSFDTIAIAVLVALGCFVFSGLIALGVGLDHHTKHGSFVRGDPAAGAMILLVGAALAAGSALVQRSHYKHVQRLVRETKARPATLFVTSRQQQVKGGTVTVFEGRVFENGRLSLKVELGQRPGWLEGWDGDAVGVYGGGSLEPVVITDGEKLHVIRWMNVSSVSRR